MPTQGPLDHVPLFSGLTAGELAGLAALIRRHRYTAGEIIFHEGDEGTALFVIEKGEVKIVLRSAEGKEILLPLLGPGDAFGELALFDDKPRSADAVAKDITDVLILKRQDFQRFVADHPQVALNLLRVLSQRLRQTDELVADAVFLDVRARLVKLLLDLARKQDQPGPGGSVVLTSRLTQTDLANMIGATRESVNKWLGYYVEKGLVRHDRGQLTLLDVERLRKELS